MPESIDASIDCVEGVIYGDYGKKLAHWETNGRDWWFVKHTHPLDTLEHIRRDGVRLHYPVRIDNSRDVRSVAQHLYLEFKSGKYDATT